jgi:hypothetical protein
VKKKIVLLSIILIPSLIYFFFELSEVNFKKMAFYGPKTLDEKGDTVYYTIPENALLFSKAFEETNTDSLGNQYTVRFSKEKEQENEAVVVLFIDKEQESKLAGLLEFEKYKKEKLLKLKVIIVREPKVYPTKNDSLYYERYLNDSLGIKMDNFFIRTTAHFSYAETRDLYFKQKPEHVFNYFAVIVDKDRHIRGYYDPTFIVEVKRMIEEYKHLVLKDEHANMQETNKIEKK